MNDERAQFVLAQYLIEQGRYEEARLLLRTMDRPAAQDWADRLERGEPIDPDEWRWEPDMVRPMPPPPERDWKPARIIVSLVMVIALVSPFLSMIVRSPSRQAVQANLTAGTRVRLQDYCYEQVSEAILQRRFIGRTLSCMDWSFSLPGALLEDATHCHRQARRNDYEFEQCIQDTNIAIPGILPQEQTF